MLRTTAAGGPARTLVHSFPSVVVLLLVLPSSVLAQTYPAVVRAWGSNDYGQLGNGYLPRNPVPAPVAGLSTVVRVASNGDHSLALTADGRVWEWGSGGLSAASSPNRFVPVPVPGLSGVVAVAAGMSHSLAVKADGTVWAWGDNLHGQLGDGTHDASSTPIRVPGLSGVNAVAAGRGFSVALTASGTVWTWGAAGNLGNGTTAESPGPVQASLLSGVVAISACNDHSLALRTDGTVWSWGWNGYGQLGDGVSGVNRTVPIQVVGLSNATAIAAGGDFSLALKGDGSVWAWGANWHGQLGDGTTTQHNLPAQVAGLSGVTGIGAGYSHALAVRSDGGARAWGANSEGQLGDGITERQSQPTPVSVQLTEVARVAGGAFFSVALRHDGSVWACGSNASGQLGSGTARWSPVPVTIKGLSHTAAVSTGGAHSLALQSDGSVYAWGANDTGQLGDGTVTNRPTPVRVAGLSNVVGIAAGRYHSLAVRSDGSVWAWGNNGNGQLAVGTTANPYVLLPAQVSGLSGVVAVAAGGYHSLALRSDGTVWGWGPYQGAAATPQLIPGPTDVAIVTLGFEISLALDRDGTVWQWSSSHVPAVPVQNLPAVRAIAGSSHGVAAADDGSVWVWGEWCGSEGYEFFCLPISADGRPRRVEGVSDIVAVASSAGQHEVHDLALRRDGTVWSWSYARSASQTWDLTTPVRVAGLGGATAIAASNDVHLAIVRPVTSISPQRGLTIGWTPVEMTGGFEQGSTSVTFGGVPALQVTVHDNTRLTALAPPHAPGPVDVAVTTGGETTVVPGAFTYASVLSSPPPTERRARGDLDGDGATDAVVWRPGSGTWFGLPSSGSAGPYMAVTWGVGAEGDVPVLGDYDGDGKADPAVWRAPTGTWWILPSSHNYSYGHYLAIQWGIAALGDIPVPGDYDGDGKTDPAVWRASTGMWYWLQSSTGYSRTAFGALEWGVSALGDVPVPADYDGDGKTDPAVWRASSGTWYWLRSLDAYSRAASRVVQWGVASLGDEPVPADYDGDGLIDPAVWRASTGTWYWLQSGDEYLYRSAGSRQWGVDALGDRPVPGDWDGDGRSDLAVWRRSSGVWYLLMSSTGYAGYLTVQWGQESTGDRPATGTTVNR